MSEQASYEILQFLESLLGDQPDLPDAIMHYWQRAIWATKPENPKWNEAKNCCEHMTAILAKLQAYDRDVMRVDRAKGLVSILLGAIHLAPNNYREAIDSFERGAKQLRRWRDTDIEGLGYFGRVLTHKEEENWPGALEAAQAALDTISVLPLGDKSSHIRRLQRRVEQEIVIISEASLKDRPSGSDTDDVRESSDDSEVIVEDLKQSKVSTEDTELTDQKLPTRPIPILSDIAAGLGAIAEENIVDYLLLDDNHRNGADFGVRVVGDSMKDHGIRPGDIALIRNGEARIGEIVAAVITTKIGSEGVLKIYSHHQSRGDIRHALLQSSNPLSEHLVIIPNGADVDRIEALYTKAEQQGKIRNPIKYYENAELAIVGKYVGLVRNI